MRVYAISGLSGAGKTTAREHADRIGYETVSIGATVRQAYEERGRAESIGEFVLRVHEADGRAQFTREAVATLAERRSSRSERSEGIVVEGVHSPASVRTVREAFGTVQVVWIHAPLTDRLGRLRQREPECRPSDVLTRDLRELNSGLAELAAPLGHDYCLSNGGTRDEFERRLEALFGTEA